MTRGIASPFCNHENKVVAALTVAGPIQQFIDELCREKLKDLLEATDKRSQSLCYEKKH